MRITICMLFLMIYVDFNRAYLLTPSESPPNVLNRPARSFLSWFRSKIFQVKFLAQLYSRTLLNFAHFLLEFEKSLHAEFVFVSSNGFHFSSQLRFNQIISLLPSQICLQHRYPATALWYSLCPPLHRPLLCLNFRSDYSVYLLFLSFSREDPFHAIFWKYAQFYSMRDYC